MIEVAATTPIPEVEPPFRLTFSGGQGNTDEPEVHITITTSAGEYVTGAWFPREALLHAIQRATHPVFNRTEPHPSAERNTP